MNKTTKDLLAHLMPGIFAVVALVSVLLGVPYLMAKSGVASWFFETSQAHPVIVGFALLLTGIPLLVCVRRIFGKN
ncbi:hypothetical protein ACUXAV_004959 [Cupriavidus metallidurans]|uniref:hypothetical protein n=1 Tax=Cupriavidus TaxID=106589 RepID=UPI0004936A71|nr:MULTISPECIES: hypothetical protein [Cupriavidus]AVA38094.1 hypothetical protein C3Z06_31325 [Cupriavidus metallidurans]MCA3184288.1 hypothetical protein [Cupriavidus sp.]MCA3188629.1 hypothetical protein [Cupriavidus sp.]MCA3234680.1 hypothetical protein [Cupriavidus sp.]MDE4922657.1 hypothetical protein [Cupriavidus metallidurans]